MEKSVGHMLRCGKCGRYKPDRCICGKSGKGEKGGICNRTACENSGAVYFNFSTEKYYCPSCAELLNDNNREEAMNIYGHDLCLISK